jgi:hypothetical protein
MFKHFRNSCIMCWRAVMYWRFWCQSCTILMTPVLTNVSGTQSFLIYIVSLFRLPCWRLIFTVWISLHNVISMETCVGSHQLSGVNRVFGNVTLSFFLKFSVTYIRNVSKKGCGLNVICIVYNILIFLNSEPFTEMWKK